MSKIPADLPTWTTESSVSCNEKEMFTVNYEKNLRSIKSISSLDYLCDSSSKENVELSLEVEIAESLKQLMSSPARYSSELLDVTIIQPNTCETTVNTLKGRDLGNLLATMELQQNYRALPIKESKRSVRSSSEHLRFREREIYSEQPILSAPVSARKEYRARKSKNSDAEFIPVDLMKPLLGEIRQSLKNVETRIIEIGDNNAAKSSSADDETNSNEYLQHRFYEKMNEHRTEQQIYATPLTMNKIKTKLKCQNRNCGEANDKDKPCLCQHCGMISLLMESQKQPIFDTGRKKNDQISERKEQKNFIKHNSNPDPFKRYQKDHLPPRRVVDLRTQSSLGKNYQNITIINELSAKVQSLEKRMSEQEQKSVSRDYFKRVINKIISLYSFRRHIPKRKTTSTQYSVLNLNHVDQSKSRCSGYNRNFYAHPLFVNQSVQNADGIRKEDSKGKLSIFTDLFSKSKKVLIVDEENDKIGISVEENKKKYSTQNFCRWGEEIIKPDFDLKDKIMSLLDENLLMCKKLKSKDRNEETEADCNNNTEVKEINEKTDNEIQTDINMENHLSFLADARGSFRRFLDIMSAKIYNEHITNTEKTDSPQPPVTSSLKAYAQEVNKASHNLKMDFFEPLKIPSSVKRPNVDSSYTSEKSAKCNKKKSSIPIRKPILNDKKMVNKTKSKKKLVSNLKTNVQKSINNPLIYYVFHDYSRELQRINEPYPSTSSDSPVQTTSSEIERKKSSHNLSIKYVNPRASEWKEDSLLSVPPEFVDGRIKKEGSERNKKTSHKSRKQTLEKLPLEEKLEFLKALAKSKDIDKEKLWISIWNQAKNYGKSKQDKITIQIPTGNPKTGLKNFTELEFTIEDIENLAYDKKVQRNSGYQKLVKTGDNKKYIHTQDLKKMEELHEQIGISIARNVW